MSVGIGVRPDGDEKGPAVVFHVPDGGTAEDGGVFPRLARPRFCYDDWTAARYPDPASAAKGLQKACGKTLATIVLIGTAEEAGRTYESEIWKQLYYAKTSDERDRVPVRRSFEAGEPFQFVFTDGSTLEFLPTPGGEVRVGENSIPVGTTAGLNRNNFLPHVFFRELIGQRLTHVGAETDDRPWGYGYRLSFCFENGWFLWFSFGNAPWRYRLEAEGGGRAFDLVPYRRIKEARLALCPPEISIPNGWFGHEYFTVYPLSRAAAETRRAGEYVGPRGDAFSFSSLYVMNGFFLRALEEEFDPSIRRTYLCEPGRELADWELRFFENGENVYTRDAVFRVLQKTRAVVRRIRQDPAGEDAAAFRLDFSTLLEDKEAWSDVRYERFYLPESERVGVFMDFFTRLCDRLERLLSRAGADDFIVFEGP